MLQSHVYRGEWFDSTMQEQLLQRPRRGPQDYYQHLSSNFHLAYRDPAIRFPIFKAKQS